MGCVHSSSDEAVPSVRRMPHDATTVPKGAALRGSASSIRRRRNSPSQGNVSVAPNSVGGDDHEMEWLDGRTVVDQSNSPRVAGSPAVRISRPILHDVPEPLQSGRGLFGRHSAASPHQLARPRPLVHGGASLSLLDATASASGFLAGGSETTPLNPLKARPTVDNEMHQNLASSAATEGAAEAQKQPQQRVAVVPFPTASIQRRIRRAVQRCRQARKDRIGRYYTAPGTDTDEANKTHVSRDVLPSPYDVVPHSPLMSVMRESTDGTDPAGTLFPGVVATAAADKGIVIVTTTRGKSRRWRLRCRPLSALTELSTTCKLAQEVYPTDCVSINALRRKDRLASPYAQTGLTRNDLQRPTSLRSAIEEGLYATSVQSCRTTVQLLLDPVRRTLDDFRARSCPAIRRNRAKHLEEQQRLLAIRAAGGQDSIVPHSAFRRLGVSFDDSVLRSALGMIFQEQVPASLRRLVCPSSSESEEAQLSKNIGKTCRVKRRPRKSSAIHVAERQPNEIRRREEIAKPLPHHRTARALDGDAHMRISNWLKLHSGCGSRVQPRRAIFADDIVPSINSEQTESALEEEDADYVGFQVGFRGQYECFRRPFLLADDDASTVDNNDDSGLNTDSGNEQPNEASRVRLSVGALCPDANEDTEDDVSVCSFTTEDMLRDDDGFMVAC